MNYENIEQLKLMLQNIIDRFERNPHINHEEYFVFLSNISMGYYILSDILLQNLFFNEALESINLAIQHEQQIDPANSMIQELYLLTGLDQPGTSEFKVKLMTLKTSIDSIKQNAHASRPTDSNFIAAESSYNMDLNANIPLESGDNFEILKKLGYSARQINRLNNIKYAVILKTNVIHFVLTNHNLMMFYFQTHENCIDVIVGRSSGFSTERLQCIFDPDFIDVAQTNFFAPEHLAKMLYASGRPIFASIKGFIHQMYLKLPTLTFTAADICYIVSFRSKAWGHRRLASALLYALDNPMLTAEQVTTKATSEERMDLTVREISILLYNPQLGYKDEIRRKPPASLKSNISCSPANTTVSFFVEGASLKRKRETYEMLNGLGGDTIPCSTLNP